MEDTNTSTEPVTVESATSEPIGDFGSVSQEIALQERQLGDNVGFDDGIGKVTDENGNPVFDKNGQPFLTIEDYKKAQSATQGVQSPARQQAPSNQPQNAPQSKSNVATTQGFDSYFLKDNNFDFDRFGKRSQKASEATYRSGLYPTATSTEPAQPSKPEPTPREQVETYEKEQRELHLAPLERLYASINSSLTPEQDATFRAEYNSRLEKITKEVETKKWEAIEKMASANKSVEEIAAVKQKSDLSIGKVVVDMLPEEGVKGFYDLVVGTQVGDKVIRGPGADLVDLLFDQANDGKTYKSTAEWQKAYQDWFVKFTSNEKNVRYLISQSLNNYTGKNLHRFRDQVRTTAQTEARQNKKLISPTPRSGAAPSGNASGHSSEVDAYLNGTPISRI